MRHADLTCLVVRGCAFLDEDVGIVLLHDLVLCFRLMSLLLVRLVRSVLLAQRSCALAKRSSTILQHVRTGASTHTN